MSRLQYPAPRTDQVHRAMMSMGEPLTVGDLSGLLNISRGSVSKSMSRLSDLGFAEVVSRRQRPRNPESGDFGGGLPEAVYALTEAGRDNVPNPVPHHEVGRDNGSPSIRPDDPTDFRNQPSQAPVIGETKRDPGFPILDRLQNASSISSQLRATAAMLDMDDPLRAQLLERSSEVAHLGPVEQEYLRYASLNQRAAWGKLTQRISAVGWVLIALLALLAVIYVWGGR